jgi:DNA repair protein RecO (recombination protein O)
MLHKTRGIVFQITDFGESSVVARIYTELFGLQGYLINSVRKKNAKVKKNVLHPLSLVELVVYHKERRGLHRVADVKGNPALQNIPFDLVKNSIALFLDEVLCKCIREEEPNQQLFDFLFHSIQLLDVQSPANPEFHLSFLVQLTRYLGFYPGGSYTDNQKYFDLVEGLFVKEVPGHMNYLEPEDSSRLQSIFIHSVNFSSPFQMSSAQKRLMLEKLLDYYRLHLEGFSEVKSLKVLAEVWS